MTCVSNIQESLNKQIVSKQDMTTESQTNKQKAPALLNYNICKEVDTELSLPIMARDYKGFGTGHDVQNGVIEWQKL